MLSRYFLPHICTFFLIIATTAASHAEPGITGHGPVADHRMTLSTVFNPPRPEDEVFAGMLHEKILYGSGSDIYAFTDMRVYSAGPDEYESALTTGLGLALLNGENHRLDLDLGVGYRTVETPPGLRAGHPEPGARLGLEFTARLGRSTLSLRQNLEIETERSSTASESMTTWSYAVKPRLNLELTAAARKKSRNPSADPLEVRHRTSFTLNYAF